MKSPPPERSLPQPYAVPSQQDRQQHSQPRAVDNAPSPQLMQRTQGSSSTQGIASNLLTSGGQIPFPQQVNPTQFVTGLPSSSVTGPTNCVTGSNSATVSSNSIAGPSQVAIRMPRGPSFNSNFTSRRQPAALLLSSTAINAPQAPTLTSTTAAPHVPPSTSLGMVYPLQASSPVVIPPHASSPVVIPSHTSSPVVIPPHASSPVVIPPHASSPAASPPHATLMGMAVIPQTSTNPMNVVDASQAIPTGSFAPRPLIDAPPLPTFDTPRDPPLSSTNTAGTPQAPSRIAIDAPPAPLPSSTNMASIPQDPVLDLMVDVDVPMDHLGPMNTQDETPYGTPTDMRSSLPLQDNTPIATVSSLDFGTSTNTPQGPSTADMDNRLNQLGPSSTPAQERQIPTEAPYTSPASFTVLSTELRLFIAASVEQGVLHALAKQSSPSKPDPEDEDTVDVNMHGSDGDDEDDDDDFSVCRRGRKKTGKRGVAENTFNSLLRDFLDGKGLWGSADKLRAPPTSFQIESFIEDNQGGPQVDSPQFDWTSTFKSAWNDELAYMLALDFRDTIICSNNTTTKTLFEKDDRYTSTMHIKKKIISKLARVHADWKNQQPPPPDAYETAAEKKSRIGAKKAFQDKMARRLGRRIGTFEQRGAIIKSRKEAKDVNLAFWKQVKKIHKALGQDGMSSDETDSERTPLRAKVVRRIPKVWVNAAISEIWNAVEKYGTGKGYKAGNAPYTRIFEPNSAAPTLQRISQQKCVPGLPSNYYCDLWWRGLSKTQQAVVDRQTPRELPSHECLSG